MAANRPSMVLALVLAKVLAIALVMLLAMVMATSPSVAAGLEKRLSQIGDYVVVYAAIPGCPEFPGIIAAREIGTDGEITLPGLDPIEALGLTEEEILTDVSRAVATRRPDRDIPQSLRIDVVDRQEYTALAPLYLASLHFLVDDRCDRSSSQDRRWWRDRGKRELEYIEHLQRIERDRTADP